MGCDLGSGDFSFKAYVQRTPSFPRPLLPPLLPPLGPLPQPSNEQRIQHSRDVVYDAMTNTKVDFIAALSPSERSTRQMLVNKALAAIVRSKKEDSKLLAEEIAADCNRYRSSNKNMDYTDIFKTSLLLFRLMNDELV